MALPCINSKNKELNIFQFSLPNASPSNTPSSKHGHIASSDMEKRDSASGSSDSIAGHNWVYTTWEAVCKAFSKRGFDCRENTNELEHSSQERSSSGKCYTLNRLDKLSPLGRHVLLYMSKQSALKGHVFVHPEYVAFQYKFSHSLGPHSNNHLYMRAFSVGLFQQAYSNDGVKLANRLMDSGQTKRRLHTLVFARLQGEPGMIAANSYHPLLELQTFENQQPTKPHHSPLVLIHRLSLTALKERILHATVPQQQKCFPNKEMLDSVQDFFHYTEFEGRQVFEELDRDADGRVTIDDLKEAMKRMKLPVDYAKNFMLRGQRHWPMKSFGWSDFSSLIQQKEPLIIQLFNSLGVSKSGTVRSIHLKDSLKKAGLSPTEANVSAMVKFLAVDTDEYIKYGQFRRFMLLLPMEQLTLNPWCVWLNAATAGGMEDKDLQARDFKDVFLSRARTHGLFDVAKG